MGLPNEVNSALIGAANQGGYEIDQSLRFDGSALMVRGQTGGGGSRKIHTHSHWIKRSKLSSDQVTFSWMDEGSRQFRFTWGPDDRLQMYCQALSGPYAEIYTNNQMRDTSAWYHLVVAIDTTQSAADDRMKLWVNGEQIIGDLLYYRTNFNQNVDTAVDGTARGPALGARSAIEDMKWNGYIAEVHYVNGSALTADDFGEYDSNGVWVPKQYTGSHGTTGFYLDFSNSSNLGEDQSGNGEDWGTFTNLTTSGTGTDILFDTPTNNYCTWNPLFKQGHSPAYSEGNLVVAGNPSAPVLGTIGVSSGKWYWEVKPSSNSSLIGICGPVLSSYSGNLYDQSTGYAYGHDGRKGHSGSLSSYGASYSNDLIGVALDLDAGTLVFYKNGTSQGTAFTGLSGTFFPAVSDWGTDINFTLNCGQRAFEQTVPTGYSALNTASLPTPEIADGTQYFDAKLYSGNTSTNTISGFNFSPDFVWIKSRSHASDHAIYDTVRGTNREVRTNRDTSEYTFTDSLNSFNSDGFTLGSDTGNGNVNLSGRTYVTWAWDAGSSNSSNTSGSINSTVRVNASTGVSIVSYTGGGSSGTVGHGLGVAPKTMILRDRSFTGYSWYVWHEHLAADNYFFRLNNTNAETLSNDPFGGTAPTSSVFSVGGENVVNTHNYIVYCFAEVPGFSKFGFYTGNGNSDGTFVYTGFKPRWIMIKSRPVGEWQIVDTVRSPYNPTQSTQTLEAQDAGTESNFTSRYWNGDILSNGWKYRGTQQYNATNRNYVYWAFAEHPFGGDGVSPSTAR